MFKSLSTSLIWRGILALAVGVIALAWPSVTVLALVILFAIYAFMASGMEAARAFSSRQAGPVIGHLQRGAARGTWPRGGRSSPGRAARWRYSRASAPPDG